MKINPKVFVKLSFSLFLLICAMNIMVNYFRSPSRHSKSNRNIKPLSRKFVYVYGQEIFDSIPRSFTKQAKNASVIKRRYILTSDEVLLTKEVLIDAKPCNSGQSLAVFIYSSAQSRGKYYKKRQFLRKVWIRQMKDKNVSVYFVIGLNNDPIVNKELRSEADKYSDLIQFGFIDHYYNLTLKSISMLRWIESKCQTIAYTLKTDDDVMINVENLMNRLNEFKSGITGKLWRRVSPIRDPKR